MVQTNLLMGLLYSVLAIVAWLAFLRIVNKLFPALQNKIVSWRDRSLDALKAKKRTSLPIYQVAHTVSALLRIVHWFVKLLLFCFFVLLILSFFPATQRVGSFLLGHVFSLLSTLWQGFVDFLPNLIAIIVIVVVLTLLVRFLKPLFAELGKGNVVIPGFYKEWAKPTYNLLLFLIICLGAVIIFPYIPGSESPAFRGVSLFLGVLLSLGSTAAVANIVGGIILIYTRSFTVGDFVQIGEAKGTIVEKTMLVTRIKTPKNLIVTLPNAAVLNGSIANYSASLRETKEPLVLHTTVTLGYDVPWKKVHEVLLQAAKKTKGLLSSPQAFVLQTSLDDFYVSYQLNAFTKEEKEMPRIYSELHQHIQDACNAADIEILSPHYGALRDGNHSTIPQNYLPKGYKPPGFILDTLLGAKRPKSK